MSVCLHHVSLTLELIGALRWQLATDELRGIAQRGIVRVDDDLGDDSRDVARHAGTSERVVDRLLYHVPNPPRGRGNEDAKRQRRRVVAPDLVANELVTDLRPVAVHDTDIPARAHEVDDRTEAGAG